MYAECTTESQVSLIESIVYLISYCVIGSIPSPTTVSHDDFVFFCLADNDTDRRGEECTMRHKVGLPFV